MSRWAPAKVRVLRSALRRVCPGAEVSCFLQEAPCLLWSSGRHLEMNQLSEGFSLFAKAQLFNISAQVAGELGPASSSASEILQTHSCG